MVSALTSKASSKVNFLNDDTYRRVCATVCVIRQIEQGAHYIGNSFYSLRKAFLERVVIELVYIFEEKSPIANV